MLARRSPKSRNLLTTLDTLGHFDDGFSQLVDNLFHFHGFSPLRTISNPDFSPPIDFIEKEDRYIVTAEIPGLDKKDCHIEVEDEILILKGEKVSEKEEKSDESYVCERCYGTFRREIRLPSDSNFNSVDAKYQNGVLTIDIPKVKLKEKEKKKIDIK